MDKLIVNLIEGLTPIVSLGITSLIDILPYALLIWGAWKVIRFVIDWFLFIMSVSDRDYYDVWKIRYKKWNGRS